MNARGIRPVRCSGRKASPPPPEEAKIQAILELLARTHPDAKCALGHENPFQLLVATILSAQCTDARVNLVTPGLFRRYATPAALAEATPAAIEEKIRSTGFFRAKARSLQGAARMLVETFGGQVPQSLEELIRLPGVARKTANVVLGTAFGVPSGVVVDTHVARIAQRLGLSSRQDPVRIEQDLMRLIPRRSWIDFSHQAIFHGRRICQARKPRCSECPLQHLCDYAAVARGESSQGPKLRRTPKRARQ